jgi:hypothetical protein
MKVEIHNDFLTRSWVFIITDDHGGVYFVTKDGMVREQHEQFHRVEPGLRIPAGDNTMQALADALANAGFVASQTDTRRELSAVKDHLKDMQEIAKGAVKMMLAQNTTRFLVEGDK